jgi:hypothetical protein
MSKPGQSTVVHDCTDCWGFVTEHWCESCGRVHDRGHSARCPSRPDCGDPYAGLCSSAPLKTERDTWC